MENKKINRMEENYPFFLKLCILYGIIFTFCIYDSIWGITFPIFAAVTIVAFRIYLKKMIISVRSSFLFCSAGIMLLSISTVLTANAFFYIFNWVGIILLLVTMMIQHMDGKHSWDFGKNFKNVFVLFGKTIVCTISPISHSISYGENRQQEEKKRNKTINYIFIGAICAVGLLSIVLPLLVFSDKIFANMFRRFLFLFEFETQLGILITFLIGSIGIYAFFAAGNAHDYTDTASFAGKKNSSIIGITFTGILAAIYLLYSGIQILFLFLRLADGLPGGVTFSEYAHSGFWQLLAVSLINIVTVLICKNIFEENKILKVILIIISVCTCIMAFSAAYRMLLYVGAYYLSFLRVLVLWILFVIVLIIAGVMIYVVKPAFRLFKYITIVISVCYIAVSLVKVDQIITIYNLKHWDQISYHDMVYMLEFTSVDAAPYIVELSQDKRLDPALKQEIECYFNRIKNRDNAGKKWNYSVWQAKKAAESYSLATPFAK